MADSFQPDSFTPDQQGISPQDSFQADSFVPDQGGEAASQKPTGLGGRLTTRDIQAIAQKHGVDPNELNAVVPYYASKEPEDMSLGGVAKEAAKETVGTAGRMLLGAPQFIHKKLQEPKMRAALDELSSINEEQTSPVQKAAEMVTAPLPALGELKGAGFLTKAARGAAEGAAIGGAASLATSKEGKELPSAAHGAKYGAILGIGGAALGKLLEKSEGATERAHLELQPKNAQIDIENGVQKIQKETAPSEQTLEDLIIGHKEGLNREEVEAIVREQLPEETLQKYMDPSSHEGQIIRKKVGAEGDIPDSVKRELADQVIGSRISDLAEDLAGSRPKNTEDAFQVIQDRFSKEPQYVADRYKDLVQTKQAERYLQDTGSRVESQHGFYGKAGNFISDSQYVLRDIDNRNGTDLEKILREGNKNYNKSTYVLKEYRGKLDDTFNEARNLGVADEIRGGTKIYDALQNPELLTKLSPQEQKAAEGVRNFFEDFHEFQTQKIKEKDPSIAPLPTGKLENYVPRYAKPTSEIIPMIEQKADQALGELSQELGREIKSLSDLSKAEFNKASTGPLKDLIDFSKWGNNRPPTSGPELNSYIQKALYSREGKQALEITARSSLERTGQVPDFLLEKNLFKLMDMYTANTIRGMYLRKFADQLRNRVGTLEKAGADVDADYVRKLVQDVQGVRPGTAAAANREFKTSLNRQLDSMIDKAGGPDTFLGARLTAAKAFPEILRELSLQIYPASMGLNFRSAIQNLTSSITKLAPEMGGTYGYRVLAKAAMESTPNLRTDLQKVRSMGNFPAGFVREGEAAIAEGLQATALYQIPRKALQGISSAMMSFHQLSESLNRVLSLRAGEIMGRELQAGSRAAQEALQRFPRSIQREIVQNPGQAGEILSKHLNDTTQYNYNRLSMNEFGRTMGPLFSVFTKWPAATAGDILATYREKGALAGTYRNLEKYIAPALLLHLLSVGVSGQKANEAPGEGMTDREKQLMGSHGLIQGAPIGNVLSLAKGEVGIPPAAAIAYQSLLKPALEGHAPSARALAAQTVQSFAPGVGILRFLTQDLVTYTTGHKPQGDFFEKTEEGMRRLGK